MSIEDDKKDEVKYHGVDSKSEVDKIFEVWSGGWIGNSILLPSGPKRRDPDEHFENDPEGYYRRKAYITKKSRLYDKTEEHSDYVKKSKDWPDYD